MLVKSKQQCTRNGGPGTEKTTANFPFLLAAFLQQSRWLFGNDGVKINYRCVFFKKKKYEAMIIICETLNIHLQRMQKEACEANKEVALTLFIKG